MSGGYKPLGYKELSLTEQKRHELEVSLILFPFIKEKGEQFTDSEIEFFSVWLHLFSFNAIKTRNLMVKMFSNSNRNYEILNHFQRLGLVEQVERGVYKLSSKVENVLNIIQKHGLFGDSSCPKDKPLIKKSSESEEHVL